MSKWLRLLPFALAIMSLQFVGCGDDPAAPASTCGNGAVDPGEACDDGNVLGGDGCSALCQKEVSLTCGNGKIEQGEACDDGNKIDGDGCQNDCTGELSSYDLPLRYLPAPHKTCPPPNP